MEQNPWEAGNLLSNHNPLGKVPVLVLEDGTNLFDSRAAVDTMARDLGDRTWCNGEAYSLAAIATGVALGYLDFCHPEFTWRDNAPNLSRLLQKLSKRPSFERTLPG